MESRQGFKKAENARAARWLTKSGLAAISSSVKIIVEVPVPPVTLNEIKQEVKNLNNKKAGYVLITSQINKTHMTDKTLRKIQHIINAVYRLGSVLSQWKLAEIIMTPEPNKTL